VKKMNKEACVSITLTQIYNELQNLRKDNAKQHEEILAMIVQIDASNKLDHEKIRGVADTTKLVLGGAIFAGLLVVGWFWGILSGVLK